MAQKIDKDLLKIYELLTVIKNKYEWKQRGKGDNIIIYAPKPADRPIVREEIKIFYRKIKLM